MRHWKVDKMSLGAAANNRRESAVGSRAATASDRRESAVASALGGGRGRVPLAACPPVRAPRVFATADCARGLAPLAVAPVVWACSSRGCHGQRPEGVGRGRGGCGHHRRLVRLCRQRGLDDSLRWPWRLAHPAGGECSPRRAFTLVELMVAVAAVALLILGIGQIFTSVGRLVGSGAAVAETDQFARGIEAQLREDFRLLARMRSEDTFLAIRCRKLGDANRNGTLDPNERAVYVTADDRDADRREGISPYARGSRAVTVRLDEIMFIRPVGRDARTCQHLPAISETPDSADHVRVYYGHGLRPAIDPRFDVLAPDLSASSNVPPRLWFPDGDFAAKPGDPNVYYPGSPAPVATELVRVRGRNELAGDWLLLRQPLLLSGGLAAGMVVNPPQPSRRYWTYTPFIRGLEATERSWSDDGWGTTQPLNDSDNATPTPRNFGANRAGGPFPRVLYHGRADLCAQGLTEVRRWLEGLAPLTTGAPTLADLPDATAFSGGRMDDPTVGSGWDPNPPPIGPGHAWAQNPSAKRIDEPLWWRVEPTMTGLPQQEVQRLNHIGVSRAIAGCFARFQCDDAPPMVDRGDTLNNVAGAAGVDRGPNPVPGSLALMDSHAVIAGRVSNFEVAWSDGRTWLYNASIDRDGDGMNDTFRGDVLWYDIEFARYDDTASASRPSRSLLRLDVSDLYRTSEETPSSDKILTRPETYPGERSRLVMTGPPFGPHGRYDPRTTGAEPPFDGGTGEHEYLAIFPFRRADGSGGYTGAYPKPKLIRVRMTVHDSQFRIAGGRRYEFILPVELK